MGSEENLDRVYQHKIGHFYSSDWDQSGNFGNSCTVSQNEFANPHYSAVNENQTSHLVHFPSDSGLVDLLPKIPSLGSGSLSEMASSFGIQRSDSPENRQNSEDGLLGVSFNGKRKRKLPGPVSSKNVEVEEQNDPSGIPKKDGENKNTGGNSKENYIHLRAKKGQATNSHSLAERVRREKISERMKLLQELVPGCDKITGKAVMLDEIINYVQSLQQQVEFLSMKLATVNPEQNVDIERLLSKDILHSRGNNNATALGLGPGLNLSHPFPGFSEGATPPFHLLPQNLWNNELQSILQMGYDPNPSN